MPLPVGFCLGTFGVSYAELRNAARLLDALRFDSVWLWDHYVSWNDPREPVIEGLTALAALAEATQHIRLGPLVANNLNRHPGRLAKIAATLQEIAQGRFELGIGGGGWKPEQEAFGIEQGTLDERTGRVAEALQIIRLLWSGEPVTFDGRDYRLTGAIVAPPPHPLPPIIVGARGTRLCRIAGRFADGLNVQWRDHARLDEQIAALDEGLAEAGRTRAKFDLSVHADWRDLHPDPLTTLDRWQALGFTRAIIAMAAPFRSEDFRRLAQALHLTR
jgi:alkanesulfonate monooxygenase SsuD/methylene tetrahydromethanopterin reductase-like flavin-dependent oxidoreductase (luciferase family)